MAQQPDFERVVPKNSQELFKNLTKIHDKRKYLVGYKVNLSSNRVEVDLNNTANKWGNADFYFPLKKGKAEEAQKLLDSIFRNSSLGYPPSETDAQHLFDMIDPQGQ